MQILLLQTFSTCSIPNMAEWGSNLQPQLPVPVAAVSVFYTPDDGRLTPETCRESLQ